MNERFPYAARSWSSIQIRDVDPTGRTIHGTVVPYGEVATVDDGDGPYRETFLQGAFTRSIEQAGAKVPLYPQHNHREFPLTRGATWTDGASGLDGAFLLPSTRAADDALTLVNEGIIDAFSVGFRGVKARNEAGVTVRTEAALLEVSLVANPAYKKATIAGVRAEDLHPQEFAEWVASLDEEDRAALRAALDVPADGTDVSPDTTPASGTGDRSNLRAVRFGLLTD